MMAQDFYSETACANCGDVIEAGEYRVVVMAVEMKPENLDDDTPAGRGESDTQHYCDRCAVTLDKFVIENRWKELSDDLAQASAGPASEDAHFRAETGNRAARRTTARSGISLKQSGPENDEANLSMADRENIKFSDWVGPGQAAIKGDVPLKARSVESVRRETLAKYRKDRNSSGKMKPTMRQAVDLYVAGMGQTEIARKLGVDQGTISRMLREALLMAGAAA